MGRFNPSLHPRDARGRFRRKGGGIRAARARYNRDRVAVRIRQEREYVRATGDVMPLKQAARFEAKNQRMLAKAARLEGSRVKR